MTAPTTTTPLLDRMSDRSQPCHCRSCPRRVDAFDIACGPCSAGDHPAGCDFGGGQRIGAAAVRRPRWLDRIGKDLTGAVAL